jgi:hypothetical protein
VAHFNENEGQAMTSREDVLNRVCAKRTGTASVVAKRAMAGGALEGLGTEAAPSETLERELTKFGRTDLIAALR